MKKLGYLFMLVVFLWALPGIGQASAASNSIYLDGQELEQPSHAKAGLIKGSVMVPIRVIVEGLGYEVGWDKETGTVAIAQGDRSLQLFIDNTKAVVDGKSVTLASPPLLQADTTLVPLRFVGEQMGLQVSWDNESKSAHLYSAREGLLDGVVNGSGSTPAASGGAAAPEQPVKQPGTTDQNQSGTSVTGNESADLAVITSLSFSDNRLMISADRNVIPNVFKMTGPERIVVDVPNARFADGFIDALPLDSSNQGKLEVEGYPEVSQVRYSLFNNNPSTIRIVIDLNVSRGFAVTNENGLTFIELTTDSMAPSTPVRPDGKRLVIVDPGHGGSDPGTTSITNVKEKDFNLAVGLRVDALLKDDPDILIVLTRSDDTYPTRDQRVKLANDLQADIFISIHANSVDNSPTANGTETLYTRDSSIPLADVIHKHLLEAVGLKDRNVRQRNLQVTRETTMPAVLLEAGFLSNAHDDAVLKDPVVQDKIAAGIVAAIREYFGLK
ncbi:N-acetylmuramoyl-L-alanine amidase family protein [Paenibacillus fonticola]|uniref:N-acetylmuramoyl-L-alanine amidase family protein n=1 Tax=Paenibacillus fonticola TaxID=379896 RepID=UPI000476D134|nr:N-acetylmuramoyl-L-alanine amidase family protein [Paenibacillus fonticola]